MSGEDLYDKMMRRQEIRHKKELESKIPQLRDNQILESFPSDIIQDQQAIKVLKNTTGLEDNEIVTSINRLIQGRKISTSFDSKTEIMAKEESL